MPTHRIVDPAAILLVVATLGGLGAGGCRPDPRGGGGAAGAARGAIPADPPSITGVVTAAGPGRTLRIEERPEDTSGSAKAQVRVADGATILERSGRAHGFDEIRVGALVSAWFTGPVAESYPVQATARMLVIEAFPQ
ncbi:MAG TPA: DUF3221 domain-containing protein [Gemmatimonadaceae bacterium]|nr:DUF3221 domain-containing protein [Gemmatimonadaceae bacterium]